MWEELLSVISDRDYPLESMQENIAGYVDPKTGWDLSLINPWFTERGYEFVGYLDLFSEKSLAVCTWLSMVLCGAVALMPLTTVYGIIPTP